MLLDQRSDQCRLVREVLVQRADRYPGGLGDEVGGEAIEAALDQNASRRFQDRVDGRPAARLARSFSGRGPDLALHLEAHLPAALGGDDASWQCEQSLAF